MVLPATSVARKQDASWSERAKSLVYSGGKLSTQQLRTQRWFGLQRETQWDDYTIGAHASGFIQVLDYGDSCVIIQSMLPGSSLC